MSSDSGWGRPQGQQAGGPSGPPPRSGGRRALPWVLGACGCVLVLLLGIAVIGGAVWVTSRDGNGPSTTGPTAVPTSTHGPSAEASPTFEVLPPYDPPTGDAETLRAVLEDNPVMAVRLTPPGECAARTPKGPVETKDLQTFLEAAAPCLDSTYSGGFSDQDLPWSGPDVAAFSWPDVPGDATCAKDTFREEDVRYCLLDETVYWPDSMDAGTGSGHADATQTAQLYYFYLSVTYGRIAIMNSSLITYISEYRTQLGDDQKALDEASRRFRAQSACLGAAAAAVAPDDLAPASEVRDYVLDPRAWPAGGAAGDPSADTMAHWVQKGLDADGDLGQCSTWTAPADEVA